MAFKPSSRVFSLLFLLVLSLYTIEGAPKGLRKEHVKKSRTNKKLQTKSYIDIDASDPFKVPKSSKYVDQPIPDFDEARTKVENEEGVPQSGKMESLNINQDLPASLENLNQDANSDEGAKFRADVAKDDTDTTATQPQTTGEEQGAAAEATEEAPRQPDAAGSEAESQPAPEAEQTDENGARNGLERHNVPKRTEQFGKEFDHGEETPSEDEGVGGREKSNEE